MYSHKQLGLDEPASYDEMTDKHTTLAAEAQARGDVPGEGLALGRVAWALEKQGKAKLALQYVEQARSLLRRADEEWWRDEWWRYAVLCHSAAVWKFHNTDLAAPPADDFLEAARIRLANGDTLGAAAARHNLAYTQLMLGYHQDAMASYEHASDLLHEVAIGPDREAAAIADRERGYVLSHVAFAIARHGTVRGALDATMEYFSHVARTSIHREPTLAYLAPGVALAGSSPESSLEADALTQLTGLRLDAETWLRAAVREASDAMLSQRINPSTGRAADLGSHLLALVELSRWCSANNQTDEAEHCAKEAFGLAYARGWHGEAARIKRTLGLPESL